MHFEPWSDLYDCKNCTKEDKKIRGCKRVKSNWKIEVDCKCKKNKSCDVCKGTGKFTFDKCPNKVYGSTDVNFLVPFFIVWRKNNFSVFPDGKSQLDQPEKLVSAFQVLQWIFSELEFKMQEKAYKDIKTR